MLSYVCLWSYGWYWSIRSPAMFCTPIAESMDGSKLATYATRQAEVPTLQPGPVGWWLVFSYEINSLFKGSLKGQAKKVENHQPSTYQTTEVDLDVTVSIISICLADSKRHVSATANLSPTSSLCGLNHRKSYVLSHLWTTPVVLYIFNASLPLSPLWKIYDEMQLV